MNMKKITFAFAILGFALLSNAQDAAPATTSKPAADKTVPALKKVEKPATLPDGGIQVFFKKKFVYPPRTNFTGNVIVNYIVEFDGTLSDIKVVTPCPDKIKEEVERVILKSSGLWTPAQHEGEMARQLVASQFKIIAP
jgi:hypothetical protein